MCPLCKHQLAWYDLVPLASWLVLRGHCRYCRKPISGQYPAVEASLGLVFGLSYLFWPQTVHIGGQWVLLAGWLVSSVGLAALAVYDMRWGFLPSRIIYATLPAAVISRLTYIIFFDSRPWHSLLLWLAAVAVASGVFFVLYTVNDRLIGFGDVRLGLITGTLLGTPQLSLAMIFLASLIGSLVALPDLIRGRKTMASRLPYGPFLIGATAVLVVFGGRLLDWYGGLIGIK
jgi:prepilin signal peptidase PulO-like enzyme (type II secretory pathway)